MTGGGYNSSTIDNVVEFAKSSATTYVVIAVNQFTSASSISAHAICAAGNVTATRAAVRSQATSVADLVQQMQAAANARH